MSKFKLLKGSRVVATADTLPEAEKYAKAHGCRVMQDASGRKNGRPGSQEYYYFQIRYNDGSVSNHEMMADEDRLLAWVRSQVGWRGKIPVSVTFNSRGNPKKTVDLPRSNPSSGAKQRQRGTREDAGEGAGASLGWAAHYRQAAKRYKADPTEGDAAAAIEHHRQELEDVRQRYPSSRLPGSRANPSPDAHGQRARQDLQDLEWSRTPHPDDVRATDADRKAGHFEQIRRASTAFREAEHSDIPELISEAHGTLQKVYGEFMARKNGAGGASYLHLTDYLANGLEHEQSAAAAVAYLNRCGYSAALAADVVEQCFSGHCDAQDAVDAALARHGVDLPYRSNSTIEVRRNGYHPAEKWAKGERKPAIDFGEMGQDRQALAKWLKEHPGKTAAFRAAGTVYHSAQFDGQVFTVPASRKNGATHGATNRAFLNRLEAPARDSILKSIAKHYGISAREVLDEVTHDEAEHLLDYMTEPERSATSVLMQRHGAVRRNGATAAPDPAHFAEYQRLFSAALASQADKRKRLRGDLHAMSIEGPTAAEKALERFIERIGPDEWDRVTQQALRAYQ